MTLQKRLLLTAALLLIISISASGQNSDLLAAKLPQPVPTKTAPASEIPLDLNLLWSAVHAPFKLREESFLTPVKERTGYAEDQVINFGVFSLRSEVTPCGPNTLRCVIHYEEPKIWLRWWGIRPTGQFGRDRVIVGRHEYSAFKISGGLVKRF